jgi:ribonucleoside-diphosphate reductase alpha chain
MTYTYDEAHEASVAYFGGDDLGADVFCGKYALRNEKGELLEKTPTDMHRRMAREFARIEAMYSNPMSEDEVFVLLDTWQVVPQGSQMSGVGNTHQLQSLSNCFVIKSPSDSYGGILKADQEQVQIMKRRGGVGFDISKIRPRGLNTTNAARTTDGIGVFMDRFSNTCREVAQGGRRGALMLSISCHHPEIETFIDIKRNLKRVTGANVSIRMTDEFMQAVCDGTDVQLRFPVEPDVKHTVTRSVPARELWAKIVDAAWTMAEPGLLFWDTIIRYSPADCYATSGFETTGTNPCSELPLSNYDSCRLSLVNVDKFVVKPYTPEARFNFVAFHDVVVKAQRLMDDTVDLELEAISRIIAKIEADPEDAETKRVEFDLWKRIKNACADGRRTGLGLTGLGDAIASLGIVYGSPKSVKVTEDIYKHLCLGAYESSIAMAKERGSFSCWDKKLEKGHPFIARVLESLPKDVQDSHQRHGRRNISLLTTAPAGSVSIMTQTTSGCEPAYMLSYRRRRKVNPNDAAARIDFIDASGDKWQEYVVRHPGLLRWASVTGKDPDKDVALSPYAGATSSEIDWVASVKLQAAAQRWVDHAISRTINLPNDVNQETVGEIYMEAWKSACKGITIYRDGSRDGVLVAETPVTSNTIIEHHAPPRSESLECDVHRVTIKGDAYLVLVGLLGGKPYEIFAGLSEKVDLPKKAKRGTIIKNGKKNGVATYNLSIPVGDDDCVVFKDIVNLFENKTYGDFTRTFSLALRHGVPVQFLAEQLRKSQSADMTSFTSVIARVLSKAYVPDGTKTSMKCQQCGTGTLAYVEGCVSCTNCSWTKCG